jgi:hypothetical protein
MTTVEQGGRSDPFADIVKSLEPFDDLMQAVGKKCGNLACLTAQERHARELQWWVGDDNRLTVDQGSQLILEKVGCPLQADSVRRGAPDAPSL